MKYLAVFALICCLVASAFAALKNPICGEQFGVKGTCRSLQPMWTYRPNTNECITFQYSGCQGNNNLFTRSRNAKRNAKFKCPFSHE
ncbi:GD22738 [Drosophila simulans]|uniref:GD22738 n=1 Tax=Drosophila simulans TaxID=7240 RepID=B4Q9N5_DROSI|nr:GD22738 [Drosophila simulans]